MQSSECHETADAAILTTDTLKVELSLKWGNVQFSTAGGENLLRERNSIPRTYEPVELNGEKTFHVEDRFAPDFSEGFYGLGQHQSGMFNYRGATVELGAEQHRCRDSFAVVEQRLCVDVEHRLADACR